MADLPFYEIPEELTGGEGYAPGGLYEKAVEESVDADNEWLAKAAVVGLGIHGLGRLMKYNVYAALANKFGKLSRYAETFKPRPDQVSLGRYTNLLRTLGGAAKLSGAQLTSGTRLGDISIVQDLAATLDKAGDPNSPYTNSLIKKSRAWYNTLQSMEPEVGLLHRDLDYLRISDIIDPNSPYLAAKSHSKLEVDVLRKAVEKKIVSPDLILDPRIHKDATNKVIDSRALSPFGFFEDLEKIFNPFGLTTALKSFSQNPRSFAVVGDITEQNADMIFIGGNVYKADQLGLQLAESNKILGHIGDSRHTAALVREHPQVIKYNKGYVPTWYEKLQDSIGVGTKFHEKRGGLIQTAGTFVKNLYGVATGQAELYGKEYKYRHENIYTHFITPYQFTDPEFEKIGKDIIKSKFGEGRLDPTAVIPKRGVLKGARGLLDRAKAYAGISGDLAVVKSEALDRIENPKAVPLSKEDLYVQYGRAGLGSTEKTIGKSPGAVQSLTVLGQKEYVRRPEYYAASGNSIDRIYDFANWMTIRMNKLSSASLLGVGFRPSGNILANVGRLATIPLAYYFGKEAIEYADYGIEKTLGKGPIEMAADLYTSARVAQQEARESLGITEAAETFENRMFPGLNFGLLGSIAAGIAGVKNLEKGAFFKALLSSGLIYGAAGGPDVTQSADSLKREYSGEEKVEVRKGRWWLLGYQPFSGGQVDYYKPSWYTELKQRPFDTNVYGSRENYWKHGSALPTPSNWFGLRTLIDPYAVERMNYYDRPYPTTAKMFEEVPIIGPMLADTVGELIKPQKRMHIGEQTYMTAASNISQKGVPTNAARMLGIPEVPVSIIDLNRGENLADRLDKWANVGLEPTGVWKFALSLFGIKFGEDYQMASATNIGSVGRRFYDKNLGGGFGETEFIRRFLLSEYGVPSKINAQINPIANTMPRWLPGSTSDISGDRQYFVDFNKGDAYCVTADTLIEVDGNKLLSADMVVVGDTIRTHNGNVVPVKALAVRPLRENERLIELKASSLYAFPVKASEEHPIWTLNGWVPIKDIAIGDYIGYPVPDRASLLWQCDIIDLSEYTDLPRSRDHIYIQGSQEYADCVWYLENVKSSFSYGERKDIPFKPRIIEHAQRAIKNRSYRRIPRYINISDPDWGTLVGYYIAEGSITKSKHGPTGINFAFHKDETAYHSEVLAAFEKLFNVTGKVYYNKTNGCNLVVSNKALGQIFERLLKSGFDKKELTALTEDSILLALRAIFNGDGSYFIDNNKGTLSLTLNNPTLLYQIRQVLLTYGWIACINSNHLILRGLQAEQCAIALGTKYCSGNKSNTSAKWSYIENGYVWMRVGSIQDIDPELVYGFEVGIDDSFCVAGIATHNTKIPGGEYRLPGAGYESVNRMHSGVAGAYSDIDKFLILADVAPFSQSYYKYESIANKSDLSPYWAWKVQQAKDQREKKLQRYDFDTSRNSQDILTELNNRSAVDVVGAGWRVVYEEGLSNIPLIGAKLFPNKDPYETYVANVVEGETFADWTKPYETIIRPELYTTAGLNPILAAKRGMSIGAMMSSSYASFINPFPFMAGNPIGMAGAGALIGATSSLIRMGSTQTWEHGFVPSHVKKERETEEYLDYLKYAKFRYLEAQATNQGKEDLAQTFASQAKQTVNYGLAVFKDTGDFIRYQGSLNRIDRPFFDAFLHAPYDDREKILAVVPEHMKEVLSTVWKKQGLTPNKEPRQVTADKQALEYFSEHQLPSRSWAGWNPSVPDTAIRIKAVHGGINGVSDSMHRFGIFPAQTKEALVRFPFVEAPTTDLGGGSEASMRLMASNFLGKENPFDEISFSRQSSGSGPKVDWFSAYLADSRRDDVFTFFQDAYR